MSFTDPYFLRGKREGRQKDREDIIVRIMRKYHLTYDQTVEVLDLGESDRERYREAAEKKALRSGEKQPEEGPVDMRALTEEIDRGVAKKKAEEMEEGREIAIVKLIVPMILKRHLTYDQAADFLCLSKSDKERCRESADRALRLRETKQPEKKEKSTGRTADDPKIQQSIRRSRKKRLQQGIQIGVDKRNIELIIKLMRKTDLLYDQISELMDLSQDDKDRYRAVVRKRILSS